MLRNLDNFPPGAFYSTPLQLGTKEYTGRIISILYSKKLSRLLENFIWSGNIDLFDSIF